MNTQKELFNRIQSFIAARRSVDVFFSLLRPDRFMCTVVWLTNESQGHALHVFAYAEGKTMEESFDAMIKTAELTEGVYRQMGEKVMAGLEYVSSQLDKISKTLDAAVSQGFPNPAFGCDDDDDDDDDGDDEIQVMTTANVNNVLDEFNAAQQDSDDSRRYLVDEIAPFTPGSNMSSMNIIIESQEIRGNIPGFIPDNTASDGVSRIMTSWDTASGDSISTRAVARLNESGDIINIKTGNDSDVSI
jgi:hypothetical protein